MCHKKCSDKVFTKCIRESNQSFAGIQGLRYNIPHEFESFFNAKPSWCCHCGSMVGFNSAERCKADHCGFVCHKSCEVYVNNHCGLTKSKAQELISANAQTAAKKAGKVTTPVVSLDGRIQDKSPATPVAPTLHATAITPPSTPTTSEASPQAGVRPLSVDVASKLRIDEAIEFPVTPNSAQEIPQLSMSNFDFKAVLGKGNFGKVMLAEEKTTKRLFAMKALKKEFILENDEIDSVLTERKVFLCAQQHPFFVHIYGSFQSDTHLFFVMEFVPGGDLMWHIQRILFSQDRARFYAAEVLLSLKFLHENNMVYRDLKLDNILLASDGHVKLADYGLCKDNMIPGKRTSTFCGTPEFMAPEVVRELSYDRAVDWWGFGVLVYEMLLAQAPFKGRDESEIFNAILKNDPLYPSSLSTVAEDLIRQVVIRLISGVLAAYGSI